MRSWLEKEKAKMPRGALPLGAGACQVDAGRLEEHGVEVLTNACPCKQTCTYPSSLTAHLVNDWSRQ
jgi:hypothetical protein